jgi:hypothetical protein
VSVQPFTSAARVRPGGTATFVVWVWTTQASARHVTVHAKTNHIKGIGKTRFTICPNPSRATCTLGNLPRGQADELKVRVKVRKAAIPGRHLKLTAKAEAPGAVSFSATGSFKIVSAPASPAPTSPAPSAASAPPLPPIPLPDPSGSGTSPVGLFPTVSPQPSAGPSAGTSATVHKAIRATRASDTLPLNTRLIGGQLAGLVVLAAAITIAIARLSLRPQRPLDAKNSPGDE